MSTIFWAVFFANLGAYVVFDVLKDLNNFYMRKKRKKELEAYLQQLEDEEADDDWDEDEDE